MSETKQLREHVVELLQKGHAHMSFAEAVSDFPQKLMNTRPPNVSYTFWHLVEHLRRTQNDILVFCVNPKYTYMKWPDDYWPKKDAKATKAVWSKSIEDFQKDLDKMVKLVKNPKTDLYAKIPWGEGQTIFREALVIADHNAYHIGELAILRQTTNAWGKRK